MPEQNQPTLTLETRASLADIPREQWQRLAGEHNPFLRYEFLMALEDTGCTTADTGWAPSHLVFTEGGQIRGLAPAWLKGHSMGEYVFDWAWADAYERYGVPYYPKLLIAVPFTPCQGPRLLLEPELRQQLANGALPRLLDQLIEAQGVSSWHLLFPNTDDQNLLNTDQALHRIGCQFHWQSRSYQTFDDYLAQLTSRKRKSIRKERKQVADQGITFRHFYGRDISDQVLGAFFMFYQATYLKRGQRPYLNRAFFEQIRETMPETLHLIIAVKDGELIAGALFLAGQDTLYGRYWGCLDEYNHLHFETCYYQGIDLALSLGLTRFDAGAQGEHKLVRGFEPVVTHSWHGIAHPGFRDAIGQFTQDEAAQVRRYIADAHTALPYRNNEHSPENS